MTDARNYVNGCWSRWGGKKPEDRRAWRGYYCVRPLNHTGSCAMEPRWWRKILNIMSR